jgi:PKD repeat protein
MTPFRATRTRSWSPLRTTGRGLLAALLATMLSAGSAFAQVGDIGFEGPSSVGISGSAPTASKQESKLWHNDGYWWSVMWDGASSSNRIFRLNQSTHTWVNTGVVVDPRSSTRSDALWDGTRLYIASHWFSNTAAAGKPSYLYRYSYNSADETYSLDSGFPVTVNNSKSEALVLDKDSTGKLWVSWAQEGMVYVNRSLSDDRSWGTPFVLPVQGANTMLADDMSSIVAFGNRVGVLWSNQSEATMYWSEHIDGQPDTSWQPSQAALRGDANNWADDHMNLKADESGRVFAATKTSESSPAGPLVFLLVRNPNTGGWSNHVFGRKSDRHTRPILMLDSTNQMVHMYATSGEAGGTIYRKSTSMDSPSFPLGKGTPFIQDGDGADMNDATGTKQVITAETGLTLLASNDTTDFYWHNFDPLVLGANFSPSHTTSLAPLNVQFQDTSTGYPTAWHWDFGDGTSSTEQNPTHAYTQAGSYTVSLTVTDRSGNVDTISRTNLVRALPSVAFAPVADAYVNSSYPDRNYATYPTLRVRYGDLKTTTRSFIKFDVAGLTKPVVAAKLRLWVNDPSTVGGTVHTASNDWTETGLTWPIAPPIDETTTLATIGNVADETWVDIDLPAAPFANGDGTYTLAILSTSPNDAWYSSKEGTAAPQLFLGFDD